jgi:hypothetical protein
MKLGLNEIGHEDVNWNKNVSGYSPVNTVKNLQEYDLLSGYQLLKKGSSHEDN